MKVVDENGETEMNEDQWEAASTSSAELCVFFTNRQDRYLHRLCNGKILNDQAGLTPINKYAIVYRRSVHIALDNGLGPSASIS
jgi:hypothetical protein